QPARWHPGRALRRARRRPGGGRQGSLSRWPDPRPRHARPAPARPPSRGGVHVGRGASRRRRAFARVPGLPDLHGPRGAQAGVPAAGGRCRMLVLGDERMAIGVDIGGTTVAAGVVRADGRIVEQIRIPTPQDGDEKVIVTALVAVIDQLRALQPAVEAIGAGAAGLVQWPAGKVVWAPHNPYRDLPLRRLLHERTGPPT